MRTKSTLCLMASFCMLMFAITTHADKARPALNLESIFSTPEFRSQGLDNVQWSEDGACFTFTRRNTETGLLDIYEHEIATAEEHVLLSSDQLKHNGEPVEMSSYQWSDDRRFLLITGPVNRTWDSIREAPRWVYDNLNKSMMAMAGENTALRNVYLSPDGKHAGYVLDNNLYVADLEKGHVHAVTTDGSENIFNGIFDYGSTEFGFTDAWHWSPDGQKIAFWRLDVTELKVFYMIDELGKYNEIRALKYPNTSEKHAINQIGVFDLNSGETTWMDIGVNKDDYIPRIDWTRSSGKLSIQRLARSHELLDLLMADVETGETRIVMSETDPAWIDITTDLMFFEDQDRFVWTSEKSGYRHAYVHDYEGNEKQLTSGDWEIVRLIAIDEAAGWLYFYAKKDCLTEQHVYRVALEGSEVEKLSGEPGWYDWKFSPDRSQVIQSYSNASSPPTISLIHPPGEHVRVLVENKLEGLSKYDLY